MAETQNFFDNPMKGSAGSNAWGAAGGALVGALVGESGIFGGGNKGNSVTPDQLATAINGLQGNIQRDQLQGGIGSIETAIAGLKGNFGQDLGILGAALGAGIAGVKDAVVAASSQNALSLCGLGNSVSQGFAQTNFNIQAQGAASRELALQQALDAERARATELRIELSEHKNASQHATTQILLNQVIKAQG